MIWKTSCSKPLQKNDIYRTWNTQKLLFVMSLVFISMLVTSSPSKRPVFSINTIVLDAGHGGKDRGCASPNLLKEKDVALDIVLKLGKLISDSMPDVKVVYTRNSDVFVPLSDRAQIANEANADLFISVHCNAHPNKAMHGAETFVMGLHKNEDNLSLCKRENDVIQIESNMENDSEYHLPDLDTPEGKVWLSMYQRLNLENSVDIASEVQNEVRNKGKLKDLGVNQAGFLVLWKTKMPSILVETGYLTNHKDESYLSSDLGKNETAANIFEALKNTRLN